MTLGDIPAAAMEQKLGKQYGSGPARGFSAGSITDGKTVGSALVSVVPSSFLRDSTELDDLLSQVSGVETQADLDPPDV